ncbi:MAG: AAA family ATPase [Acidobacteria bacterium]|nr:AAA family ATPase [Acidobacteriota bacterium]
MNQIAILTTDDHLVDMLRTLGLKSGRIDTTELAAFTRASLAPHVLVVDARGRDHLPPGLSAFRRQHPSTGAVLVVSSLDPRLMLEAMRAGVGECVTEPLTPQALDAAVRRVLTNTTEAAGQVFAFVGAKGGVGTTTMAVNTAAALGRIAKGEVLLIDMHLAHGDGAVFLGVEPRFSVIDALENVHRMDESFFGGVVEKTDIGVHLLASSPRPRQVPIDAIKIRGLIDAASRMYRMSVLDVPRSDMTMLDSLDTATSIVVVTSQEIAALRNAANMAETLRARYGTNRVKVAINRFHRESVIAHADIERAVGGTVEHLIPSDYRSAIEALNAGRPLAMDRESKLGMAFESFAKDLAGVAKEQVERPSGVLGRLAWRRA